MILAGAGQRRLFICPFRFAPGLSYIRDANISWKFRGDVNFANFFAWGIEIPNADLRSRPKRIPSANSFLSNHRLYHFLLLLLPLSSRQPVLFVSYCLFLVSSRLSVPTDGFLAHLLNVTPLLQRMTLAQPWGVASMICPCAWPADAPLHEA